MQRKQYSAEFKAKVALEALRGLKTINQIASDTNVHPNQISLWKKLALEKLPQIFSNRKGQAHQEQEELTASLHQQIGQLKAELDWVKKNLALPIATKRSLIEPDHPTISIVRQCQLLGIARSSWYYQAKGEDPYNQHLMNLISQQFAETPFYGVRRMTAWLRSQGECVNSKRVSRLMRKLGLAGTRYSPRGGNDLPLSPQDTQDT